MTVTKTIDASKYAFALAIGRQMENNYRQIIFNCAGFGVEVASIMLVHQRSQDTAPYIVAETTGEDSLTWTITNTDTAYAGTGKAELRISFTNGLAKSVVYTTHVIKSITGDTTIPAPLQSWYDAMIQYIDDHSVSPEQIDAAVAEYLEEHPVSAPVTSVNNKTGDVVLDASDVGALPDDTVIPTVPANVSAFTNDAGYISSIPAEYVTDTELQEELTDYATKAEIPEKTSELINDSGFLISESDPVFSASPAAEITAQDISDWNGKSDFSGSYNDLTNKPTIPAASSAAPADLGTAAAGSSTDYSRADHVHKKPTAADIGAYTKPSGGIPKSDLASAVQASLDKADTALQSAPVTSVNGQTGAVAVTVPTKTSELQNDSGFLTSAPVSSVDGKTGIVSVLPSGGSSGQVLSKASGTDYDVEWTTASGGGSDWTVYYENTTTADALLQIPVTNIDCTEVEVQIVMPTWSSNVNVYAPLMQTAGSHWNVNGYLRMIKEIPSNTSQKRYCVMRFEGVTITGHAYFCSWCATNTGTSNLQYKYDESANMTAGMHITALSVATIANVPAGTMVLVRGR